MALSMYIPFLLLFAKYAPTFAPNQSLSTTSIMALISGAAVGTIPVLFAWLLLSMTGTTYALTRIEGWMGFVFAMLAIGIVEEIFFRGLLFEVLRRFFGNHVGAIAVAVIFTLTHIDGVRTALDLTGLFVGCGLAYTVAILITRNLWFCVGMHASYNIFLLTSMPKMQTTSGFQGLGSQATVGATILIGNCLLLLGFVGSVWFVKKYKQRSAHLSLPTQPDLTTP